MMLLINSMNSVVSGLCALFTFGATLLHSVNAQSVDVTQVVSSTGEDCSTFSVGSSATLVMNITAASAPSWILNLNFNNVLIGTIAFPPGSTLFPNVATSEYSHRVSVKLSTTTVISRSDFFMGNLTLFELQSNESNFKFTGTGSTGLPLYFDTTLNNIQLCAASGQGVIESCSDSCVYNSSVTLSCSPGYSSSSIVTQCGDCGNFIDPLFCSPETCNALSVVDNPTMNTTLSDPSVITVNFSDIVNVTCAEGYNGTGASYMCASNDTFDLITNAPNCPIVTCDASLVLDNSTTATEKTVSFNSTLNVACNTNFTGTSGSYICNKNGNFNLSVEPTCKPVSYENCLASDVTDRLGTSSVTNVSYNGILHVTCLEDCEGSASYLCGANGQLELITNPLSCYCRLSSWAIFGISIGCFVVVLEFCNIAIVLWKSNGSGIKRFIFPFGIMNVFSGKNVNTDLKTKPDGTPGTPSAAVET